MRRHGRFRQLRPHPARTLHPQVPRSVPEMSLARRHRARRHRGARRPQSRRPARGDIATTARRSSGFEEVRATVGDVLRRRRHLPPDKPGKQALLDFVSSAVDVSQGLRPDARIRHREARRAWERARSQLELEDGPRRSSAISPKLAAGPQRIRERRTPSPRRSQTVAPARGHEPLPQGEGRRPQMDSEIRSPAGPTSGPSPSSTASTCSPPASAP